MRVKMNKTKERMNSPKSFGHKQGQGDFDRKSSFGSKRPPRAPQPLDNVVSVLLDRDFIITVKAGGKCRKFVLTFGVVIKCEKGIIRLGVARASGSSFAEARNAAISEAVKHAITIKVNKHGTFYHEFYSNFHGIRIYAYPAHDHVIKAAPCISQLLEAAGLGITCKILSGSKNVFNIIKCLLQGLNSCETTADIARRCGITIEEVLRRRYATPLNTFRKDVGETKSEVVNE